MRCADGYERIEGDYDRVCANGIWQGLPLRCRKKTLCSSNAALPPNASFVQAASIIRHQFGSACKYSFSATYSNTKSIAACSSHCQTRSDCKYFSFQGTTCRLVNRISNACVDVHGENDASVTLYSSDNSKRNCESGVVQGSVCLLKCKSEYHEPLSPLQAELCKSDGTWTGRNVAGCKPVHVCTTDLTASAPQRNSVTVSTNTCGNKLRGTKIGEKCTEKCAEHFEYESGNAVRTCTENGWSGSDLVCKYRTGCENPSNLALNSVILSPLKGPWYEGTVVSFTCKAGFEISKGVHSATSKCQSDGVYSANFHCTPIPSCRMVLPNPNADRLTERRSGVCEGAIRGDTCTLGCKYGAVEVSGMARRVCGADGLWSDEPLVCRLPDESICTTERIRAYAGKVQSGKPDSGESLPKNSDYNCTKLIDVSCEGWTVTFVPTKVKLPSDAKLYLYNGNAIDASKRIPLFRKGSGVPSESVEGEADYLSATSSESQMLLHFVTDAASRKDASSRYTGFEGYFFTGTKDYVDCVVANPEKFEVCQTAGNGIVEGEEVRVFCFMPFLFFTFVHTFGLGMR